MDLDLDWKSGMKIGKDVAFNWLKGKSENPNRKPWVLSLKIDFSRIFVPETNAMFVGHDSVGGPWT